MRYIGVVGLMRWIDGWIDTLSRVGCVWMDA